MDDNLRTFGATLDKTIEIIADIFEKSFGVPNTKAKRLIEKKLGNYFALLNDNIHTIIEFPYVDKIYRDSYYHFFSSKHSKYHRDSIRVSFFSKPVTPPDFRNKAIKNVLYSEGHYLGFLTLRPTVPNIIGRTGISPRAFRDNNFRICLSEIEATVASTKFQTIAFPHASQDGQTMTCAETTIWSLMEYFGNKYPEYKPALPSHIHSILRKFSYKRQIPSDGLTAEQLSYAIRELGFGSVIYNRAKFSVNFEAIVSTYVESGIPIIAVISDGKIGHAINIIGREEIDEGRVGEYLTISNCNNSSGTPLNLIDIHTQKRKYVYIDDNYPPYRLATLERPCFEYSGNEKWENCEINSIIVPLYSKIYLEASRARENMFRIIKSKIGIPDSEKRVIRTFLASSRSYKDYIALNAEMLDKLKVFLLSLTMPKFIWICEISKIESFQSLSCDDLIILDATEPAEFSEEDVDGLSGNTPIIATFINCKFSTESFGLFKEIDIFAPKFHIYEGNITRQS